MATGLAEPERETVTEPVYTSQAAADLVGVPYRTLMNWVARGLLAPEGAGLGRSGKMLWREKDITEARNLSQFRRRRLPPIGAVNEILAFLRELGHNPLSRGQFTITRDDQGKLQEIVKLLDGLAISLMPETRGQLELRLSEFCEEGNESRQ